MRAGTDEWVYVPRMMQQRSFANIINFDGSLLIVIGHYGAIGGCGTGVDDLAGVDVVYDRSSIVEPPPGHHETPTVRAVSSRQINSDNCEWEGKKGGKAHWTIGDAMNALARVAMAI